MPLKIKLPKNSPEPNDEVIFLTTDEDVNLKGYAIVDRTFDDSGKPSNEFRHFYAFPDYELKKNDVAALVTGTGSAKPKPVFKKGSSVIIAYHIHIFYWGSAECVWNDNGGDTATLIKYTVEDQCTVPPIEK